MDVEVGHGWNYGTGRIDLLFRDMASGGGCELVAITH